MVSSSGFVYFFVDDINNQVKIGFSKCPYKRLKSVLTSYPGTLVIKKTIQGTQKDERYYHRMFCHYKIRREWFFLSEEIKTFLSR